MELFGTDGIRGNANTELTPEMAQRLGRAAATVMVSAGERPLFLVGYDTRISCDMLAQALASGLMSAGAEVWDAGVIPTPGLAYLTGVTKATAGIMISASHNPAIDNGIKIFSRNGYKLSDEDEERIEAAMGEGALLRRVPGDQVGRFRVRHDLQEHYLNHLRALAPSFSGRRVVVDCANGAAHSLARHLFGLLGMEVVFVGVDPDGTNINVACGSTYPQTMVQAVLSSGAELGFAFDGDADRIIACDSKGNILDGDNIVAICGEHLYREGRLPGSAVVGTVMSNFGLDSLLSQKGISLLRSKVGDRYMMELMREKGAVLGAEQSGHCIFLEHSTTGDGLLTAVMLLSAESALGRSLDDLSLELIRYPQVLINVGVTDRQRVMNHPSLGEVVEEARAQLGQRGRILVRPSGTEQLVRVMVEADDEGFAEEVARSVADVIRVLSA